MLCLKSSGDCLWPWANAGPEAEAVFRQSYPSIYDYVKAHEGRLSRRSDQGKYWWELRTCSYWEAFDRDKVFWPDICKEPRFNLDKKGFYIGDTAFMVAASDYYLLGILGSWATWFCLSKTAQPLRLRGDRWQYRLKKQWLEALPIPNAVEADRKAIADVAEALNDVGQDLYEWQENVRVRLLTSFGEQPDGTIQGKLNNKASDWWQLTMNQLGSALKTSFKLKRNPFQNPNVAEEWEAYLAERRQKIQQLTTQLRETEAELNDRVYWLFDLTDDEIKLLQREVEH